MSGNQTTRNRFCIKVSVNMWKSGSSQQVINRH